MVTEFLVRDQGDGWWDCPTPLRCVVVDGPAPFFAARPDASWPETYWLVRSEPPIEWYGDERLGADSDTEPALRDPMGPTSFALVMASSPWTGPIDPEDARGVAVYPVLGAPSRVAEAEAVEGLAVKAAVLAATPKHDANRD